MQKMVYLFGGGKADGNGKMKELLGGKGANLAEMAGHRDLKLPVPPGFTITTEVCTHYYDNKKRLPQSLTSQIDNGLKFIEKIMDKGFGDPKNPLLVSVRSGARSSMPGMMETVLNVGLTTKTIPGLINLSGDERFVYDSYRRLIMMYSDVVMEKAAGVEPTEGKGIRVQLENIMAAVKKSRGVKLDTDLNTKDLILICDKFKKKIKEVIGKEFPDNAKEQLLGGITAVFSSWNGKRAIAYRKIEGIPDEWGTAVNVQAMVFGNFGDSSATGVAFTRNPENGDNDFYGEYLVKAQGEDVVAGIRTPAPINKYSQSAKNKTLPTLNTLMPEMYDQLFEIRNKLEKHFADMLDIEFTIEKDQLWMLQCRVGKRNGLAAVKMALSMYKEKMITEKEALLRVEPTQLDELLHPIVDPKEEAVKAPIAHGLPAGPGGARGQIVFSAEEAVRWKNEGKDVILVREETNPEDIEGMRAAEAILTARGGRTSHAALVARGWGKCCIVGSEDIHIDEKKKIMKAGGKTFRLGDFITLNGTKGVAYEGKMNMIQSSDTRKVLTEFLNICDKYRKLNIRANADTPKDAKAALEFGAEGIGLFRTEHMFYGENSERPLFILRKMIMAKDDSERQKYINELYPHVKSAIKGTLEAMAPRPVTIRLLDPPLHEFVPTDSKQLNILAKELEISVANLKKRAEKLHETNPMMGHRGVRLGISYPEVSKMQIRAILEAAIELNKVGKKVHPEIMIPVVGRKEELDFQKIIVNEVVAELKKTHRIPPFSLGTMIEIPRACIVADKLAETAEFFSFGTNDLTQMGFGFSRDDIGSFLPKYLCDKIIPADPFETLDTAGIGELIRMGIKGGRSTNSKLKIGICGEHGGDPKSVVFCHKIGMDYVSCSPYRIPIAKLAAAQATIE